MSDADTAASDGVSPVVVAVLRTPPASTSPWVTVYCADALTVAPGARVPVAAGQGPNVIADSPGSGSLSAMASIVAVPAFVMSNVKVTMSPTARSSVCDADLSNDNPALEAMVTVAGAVAVTTAPEGAVPRPVTRLMIEPASTSAWVSTVVAVAVTVSPGARTPAGPFHW